MAVALESRIRGGDVTESGSGMRAAAGMPSAQHRLVLLSRLEIPRGSIQTVTSKDDATVTLWVERGGVQVRDACLPQAAVAAGLFASHSALLGAGAAYLQSRGRGADVVKVTSAHS